MVFLPQEQMSHHGQSYILIVCPNATSDLIAFLDPSDLSLAEYFLLQPIGFAKGMRNTTIVSNWNMRFVCGMDLQITIYFVIFVRFAKDI